MIRHFFKIMVLGALMLCPAQMALAAAAENLESENPNIDCSKTQDKIDKIICATPTLNDLNHQLMKSYKAFAATLWDEKDLNKLAQMQESWRDNRQKVICMSGLERWTRIKARNLDRGYVSARDIIIPLSFN